ncbi:MAG: hypothetical protein ACRD1F_05415, partial [Terriglobales bacterium]
RPTSSNPCSQPRPGRSSRSRLLDRDHIPHENIEQPGAHSWTLWKQQLPGVLRLLAARWRLHQ